MVTSAMETTSTVDQSTLDALRESVASVLAELCGSAELHVWPGGFHAFDREVPEARISEAAVAARRNWLERLLATG